VLDRKAGSWRDEPHISGGDRHRYARRDEFAVARPNRPCLPGVQVNTGVSAGRVAWERKLSVELLDEYLQGVHVSGKRTGVVL